MQTERRGGRPERARTRASRAPVSAARRTAQAACQSCETRLRGVNSAAGPSPLTRTTCRPPPSRGAQGAAPPARRGQPERNRLGRAVEYKKRCFRSPVSRWRRYCTGSRLPGLTRQGGKRTLQSPKSVTVEELEMGISCLPRWHKPLMRPSRCWTPLRLWGPDSSTGHSAVVCKEEGGPA